MTFNPHPIVMIAAAEHRRAELHAQPDRERLAQRATNNGGSARLQHMPDLVAVIAIVLGLALMAAGTAAAEPQSPARPGFVRSTASVSVQGLAADNADTSAVQKVREAVH